MILLFTSYHDTGEIAHFIFPLTKKGQIHQVDNVYIRNRHKVEYSSTWPRHSRGQENQSSKVATDPKITARRYDSDTGSVSFIVFVFPIRYSVRAAQQDSAFKMTHIEAKSINIWLRYDSKWIQDVLGHISAKY